MKTMVFVAQLFVALLSADTMAADSINPGIYVTNEGWGGVTISRATPTSPMNFSIFTTSGNAHMCQVEGEIQNNQGIATKEDCVVQFEIQGNMLTVKGGAGCLDECGANTGIDGEYFLQDVMCSKTEEVRKEFTRQYQSRNYQKAKAILSELLDKCERFMTWYPQTEIRNDLAITFLHLGDKPSCLKTLEPLKEWFIDELSNGKRFSPSDKDWANAMVKATRFNWNKCGGYSN